MPTVKIAGEPAHLVPSALVGVRLNGKLKVKERAAVRVEKARAAEGNLVSLFVPSENLRLSAKSAVLFCIGTLTRSRRGSFSGAPRVP